MQSNVYQTNHSDARGVLIYKAGTGCYRLRSSGWKSKLESEYLDSYTSNNMLHLGAVHVVSQVIKLQK
jgi:hypothetical protein